LDELSRDLDRAVPLQALLGYLNFSEGRPHPRFQKGLSDAYAFLTGQGQEAPWAGLGRALRARLADLQAGGVTAFRDVRQAESVLTLALEQLLPAYRAHHADLLFHQSDADLLQPFFLARVFETLLTLGPLHKDESQVVANVLARLNDYVGHRPIAILETRPRGEPYDHERVRPIPLYLRGAGVAHGRYQDVVARALDILSTTDASIREEAYFDPTLLDELALDPRAYDHGHPANKRPNYIFGEWDAHHLDNRGRFRRFVLRQVTLDAILNRIENPGDMPRQEALIEAAVVLAGTILMASGVSGAGPDTHDSSTSLSTLIPRIARYRDRFYKEWLDKIADPHGARLRQGAEVTHQPFGSTRQQLNLYLARHRALQMQQRHLALILAAMGYPEASRRQADRIPAASVRLLSEIHNRLTTCRLQLETGEPGRAAQLLPEVEGLLHRGINCGALPDPWNILGYQGLYPLFTAMEDSVRDTRIDELIGVVEQTFYLYAQLLSEAAAAGEPTLRETLAQGLGRLASWWDQFATAEVGDVRHVRGAEVVASAEQVSKALRHWRERGQAPADLSFWHRHLEDFRSPKSFALVVEALLDKEDYRAALGLLMGWLGRAEQAPLEDGGLSFHTLTMRWMLGVCRLAARQRANPGGPALPFSPWDLAVRFLDHLEANADELWQVPRLDLAGVSQEGEAEEEVEDLYGAAYEGVTYEDSTDDEVEAEVLEVGPQRDFDLDEEARRLEKRLHFLATVARLWSIAGRLTREQRPTGKDHGALTTLNQWLARARHNYQGLLALMDAVHAYPVPEPTGATESVLEYNRRRDVKEHLLHNAIAACLDTALTVGSLQGRIQGLQQAAGGTEPVPKPAPGRPPWEPYLIRLEEALWRGDADQARSLVPPLLDLFKQEPLLYVPLAAGGNPRQILRASIAQMILRALAANLPRLGLLRETLLVVQTSHAMEQAQPPESFRVTEFGRLFQAALQGVVEAVVESVAGAGPAAEGQLLTLLEKLVHPFMALWSQHSQTFLVAILETVRSEAEWEGLRDFVRRYGRDLFHVRFLAPGNLRGILQRGVGAYLEALREHPDPQHPVLLAEELDQAIPQAEAERRLHVILQALLENYEEYKDYSASAPQSDFGDNLHILLDFLRLKSGYDRHAWQLRPLAQVHEVLARQQPEAAAQWQERFLQVTEPEAGRQLEALAELEKAHGLRLRTVADRIEERFIKPLALDRLCALIPPAMEAAGKPEAEQSLARLEAELAPHLESPTGVGLDVPAWLQRLEATVQQTRASRTALAGLAEELFRIPKRVLPLDDLRRELPEQAS
jgi:hypothetical protein